MNKSTRQLIFLSLTCCMAIAACHRKIPAEEAKKHAAEQAAKTKVLLRSIQGIHYTEVKRVFDNGISFSPQGYQLVPGWRMSFPSLDSVNIFNPKRNVFVNAPLVFDHDSVFNVAWSWLRLQKLGKDSLKFQVLKVENQVIIDQEPKVFITFYADNYIRDVLHTDTNKLWRPTRRDSLYIKVKVAHANANPDSAFAAVQPAMLTPKSPLISITNSWEGKDEINGVIQEDRYLSPQYNIVIRKAYEDFTYSFTVWVDEKGKLIFRKTSQYMMPEFRAQTLATMKGIVDGYLKLYLTATPGKTLGMPHTSIITLNVTGIKK